MVTKLHRHMGALIRQNVLASLPKDRTIRINPFLYAVGNMLPDISWLPLTQPHFQSKSKPFMSKLLDKTIQKHRRHRNDALFVSPIFSLRLGILSHYLCDYFCVAHQGNGINGARHHLNYEHSMRDFFYDHRNEIEALCHFVPTKITFAEKVESTDDVLYEFKKWHELYAERQSQFIDSFLFGDQLSDNRVDAFLTDIQTAIACCTNLIYSFAATSN